MKISLLSTMPFSEENIRIKEEAIKLGHEFIYVDVRELEIKIAGGNISVNNINTQKPDLVIVRGILQHIKTVSAVIKWLRKKGIPVFDNGLMENGYSIRKVADMIKLVDNGIAMPNTGYTTKYSRCVSFADELGYPVIFKSTVSGKGRRVYKLDTKDEFLKLIAKFEKSELPAASFLLQEFIPYVFDIRILIIGNDVYAMQRIPGEGEFRANFSLGGKVSKFDMTEEDKKLAIKALSSIDMSVGGVDILITKNGKRYVLEVNHTPGFLGMEEATGKNIARVYIEHAVAGAR